MSMQKDQKELGWQMQLEAVMINMVKKRQEVRCGVRPALALHLRRKDWRMKSLTGLTGHGASIVFEVVRSVLIPSRCRQTRRS